MKTHFKKSKDWALIKTLNSNNSQVMERILFKNTTTNTYLLAETYDGRYIKQTTIDFLKAASDDNKEKIKLETEK